MPQPDNVEFEQPAQEKIITDAAKIEQAQAGPDIHCYYCGSRNPATATTCSQCGADLSEGARRKSGQVLGTHRDKAAEPVACPACGAPNNPTAPKCARCGASLVAPQATPVAPPPVPKQTVGRQRAGLFGKIGLVVVGLLLCAALVTCVVLFTRTESLTGTVSGVSWQRTITIEELVPETKEAWHDQVPANTVLGSCTAKLRRVQDQPAPNAREVCGTPYTVDTGTGFGEVTQDCKYEVYEDYCQYQTEVWKEVDEAERSGDNLSPQWPDLALTGKQRQGERKETYTCHFQTKDGPYAYSSSNPELLSQCTPGSTWALSVNTFNMVTEIEPAN